MLSTSGSPARVGSLAILVGAAAVAVNGYSLLVSASDGLDAASAGYAAVPLACGLVAIAGGLGLRRRRRYGLWLLSGALVVVAAALVAWATAPLWSPDALGSVGMRAAFAAVLLAIVLLPARVLWSEGLRRQLE